MTSAPCLPFRPRSRSKSSLASRQLHLFLLHGSEGNAVGPGTKRSRGQQQATENVQGLLTTLGVLTMVTGFCLVTIGENCYFCLHGVFLGDLRTKVVWGMNTWHGFCSRLLKVIFLILVITTTRPFWDYFFSRLLKQIQDIEWLLFCSSHCNTRSSEYQMILSSYRRKQTMNLCRCQREVLKV